MQDQTPGVGWRIQGQNHNWGGRDDVFLLADPEASVEFIKPDDLEHKHHSSDADAKCKELTLSCQSFLLQNTKSTVL